MIRCASACGAGTTYRQRYPDIPLIWRCARTSPFFISSRVSQGEPGVCEPDPAGPSLAAAVPLPPVHAADPAPPRRDSGGRHPCPRRPRGRPPDTNPAAYSCEGRPLKPDPFTFYIADIKHGWEQGDLACRKPTYFRDSFINFANFAAARNPENETNKLEHIYYESKNRW